MHTDPHSYLRPAAAGGARYIGRVGALAVALGIGVAVAGGLGMGLAHADETGTSENPPSAGTPSGPSAPSSPEPNDHPEQQATAVGSDNDAPDAAKGGGSTTEMKVDSSGGQDTSANDGGQITDNDHPDIDKDEIGDRASAMSVSSSGGHHSQAAVKATAVDKPSSAGVVTTPTADLPTDGSLKLRRAEDPAPLADPQVSTVTTVQAAPQTFSAAMTSPDPAPTPVETSVTTFVSAVLSPLLAPDPEAPADPPLLLGMLAWARGEGQRRYSADTLAGGQQFVAALVANTAPVAVKDSAKTKEDTAVTINVLANDKDVNGDALSTAVATGPANGTLTHNADGSFTYAPNANYNGTDTFTYTANDGTTTSAPATVTVKVTAVNDAPIANADTATTTEDTPVTINVLANDTDIENNPLKAVLDTKPAHGTLVRNTDGTFTYTPKANYTGTDTFTYHATDGTRSNTATVTITITAVNDPPTAANDSVKTKEDTAVTIKVLANDKDVDGDALSTAVATGPANGTLTHNADGSFTYAPNANYNGTDTFTYTANDGTTTSAPATVTVKVTAVNDAPIANADTATTTEDTPVTINVLANDTDVENNPLKAVLDTKPAHGTLVRNTDGTFTYTPKANYTGTDTFTYHATDGTRSNTATVTITIKPAVPVNHPPVAGNDNATTNEDTAVQINVLANDSDPDGDALTTSVITGPTHGAVVHNADGSFTYTPTTNYNGSDSFTYQVSDATTTSTATVTIAINPINDAPTAGDIFFNNVPIPGGSSLVSTVRGDINDVDGDALTAAVVDQPLRGTVTMTPDGNFTYIAPTDYTGSDTFTYHVYDGTTYSNTATVTINNIVAANHAPVATNDTINMPEDSSISANLANSSSDPDGDPLTGILVSTTTHGTLTFFSNRTFTYQPDANFNGTDSFTYKVNDGTADSNVATVTIKVDAVNDAPVAGNDTATTNEDTAVQIDVLANDTDADGDPLTTSVITGPSHGAVVHNADGSFTYTPTADYNGDDSFTYGVNDGTTTSNGATVNITVKPVNDTVVAPDFTINNVPEDSALSSVVSLSTTDVDGEPLTASVVDQPLHGTVQFVSAVNYIYRPASDYNGIDTFTYRLFDGVSYSNTATVTINVTPVNDVPVAVNDNYTTAEDTALTVDGPGVRANDTDIDGAIVATTVVDGVDNGTLTLNNDGSFNYTPNANFNGTDSFTYTDTDDQGGVSTPATVTITVAPVNDIPVTVNDSYTTGEDTTLTVDAPGVRANDADIDGAIVATTVVDSVDNGTLTLNNDGSFNYTPNANFNGTDSFTYTVTDDQAGVSTAATVTLTVTAANDVPVAVNDSATTNEDTPVKINVLANDSDVDGNPLMTEVVANPTNGTVAHNADGTFTYSPAAHFTGTDSFTYRVSDGTDNSNTATVSVTVNAANKPGVVSSLGLAGALDSVSYSTDGSRALVTTKVTALVGGVTTVTGQTVVLVDTATDAAIGTPLTITGEVVNIELDGLHGGIISTSTSGGPTTTLTTIDMDTGQVVHIQPFTGHFLSVQYPDDTTAMLTTEVVSQVNQVHTVTMRFLDTYTGTTKGDNLTYVGIAEESVVTFGQLGNTVVTFTTNPDGVAHAAVFNYIDGQQQGHTINLAGTFSQPDTLSHTTFLFDQQGDPATAVIITDTGTSVTNAKTILTTIDLTTIDQNQSAAVTNVQIDGRVYSMQADPSQERAYLITEKLNTIGVVNATLLTVLNTTTGDLVDSPLTYPGEINTLILNPDHTRALLTYYEATTGAPRAAIIDTNTATQIFQTPALAGHFTDTILFTDDSTRAAILTTGTPPKGTPTTTLTTINLGTGAMVSSLGLAGALDSVSYSTDGSRALVTTKVTALVGGVTTVTGQTVVLVDTATDAAIGTPLTITGEVVNIELDGLHGGIISTSTSGGPTTTLTTIDMDTGQVVHIQPFTGHFLSVQYPDDTTAMLTTEVVSQVNQVHTVTMRFLDTYTGTTKGDNLTYVGIAEESVVTFGQLGNTVVTFTTNPDGVAHAAVFNYIDGQQQGHTINLAGTFSQPDTLSHTTFLFDQQGDPATAVIITDTGTSVTNAKTILTTIDLTTIDQNQSAAVTNVQIDGRVYSMQADPSQERAYLITEKLNTIGVVNATLLTVLNTTTGDLVDSPLTYPGEINTLILNPDHTRALLTYYEATTGAPRAAIIDTNTATQIFQTPALAGHFTDTILFTDDSTRAAILTTGTPPKGTPTTTLTTINLGHETQV